MSPALPASNYDEEFAIAKTTAFISKLENLDNIVLNDLANRRRALVFFD